MSLFDVSTITDINDYFEKMATHSCCGTSKFVKVAAKVICSDADDKAKLKMLGWFITAPDTQVSQHWRDKAKELLDDDA